VKHKFTKGEFIGDSYLKYICEAGYRGKQRYVSVYCDICGGISIKRLYKILSGEIKTCGCKQRQMLESGTLSKYSLMARKKRAWLQKGGWEWKKGICITLRYDQLDLISIDEFTKKIAEFLYDQKRNIQNNGERDSGSAEGSPDSSEKS